MLSLDTARAAEPGRQHRKSIQGDNMPDENNQDNSSAKQHGGRRSGAGRKRGSSTKKTREIADRAAAEGLTPLEVMLKAMRAIVTKAEDLQQSQAQEGDSAVAALDLMVQAAAVAKDAAPYMHPRLQSVTLKGDAENPLAVALADAASLKKLARGNSEESEAQTG
jgi:hypothetical protein